MLACLPRFISQRFVSKWQWFFNIRSTRGLWKIRLFAKGLLPLFFAMPVQSPNKNENFSNENENILSTDTFWCMCSKISPGKNIFVFTFQKSSIFEIQCPLPKGKYQSKIDLPAFKRIACMLKLKSRTAHENWVKGDFISFEWVVSAPAVCKCIYTSGWLPDLFGHCVSLCIFWINETDVSICIFG